MSILVTGGIGYIGSHTVVELLNEGYDVVVFDNFSNSKPEAIERIKQITKKDFTFYECDLLDKDGLEEIFKKHTFEAIIHFAGLKAVGESVQIPLKYYHNNITGTLILCEVASKYNVKKIIFSSSATVYGSPKTVPITEDFPTHTTNPYGSTKLMLENILSDLYISDNDWNVTLLRYFNPIGAHESGLIGEDPNGIPNNLMPYITKVAVGALPILSVYGNDYDTKDGTGVRDYIHVVDLAKGHIAALKKALNETGVFTYNLGTGIGYSVLDIVNAFMKANNIEVAYKIAPRRPGDIAMCYANPDKALKELGWKTAYNLEQMCKDSYNFAVKNF